MTMSNCVIKHTIYMHLLYTIILESKHVLTDIMYALTIYTLYCCMYNYVLYTLSKLYTSYVEHDHIYTLCTPFTAHSQIGNLNHE